MIVVEGSKIKEIGSNLAVPAGATVVDLGDATLLAGFIDSHMHLTFDAGDDYVADFFEDLRRTVAEKAVMSANSTVASISRPLTGNVPPQPSSN